MPNTSTPNSALDGPRQRILARLSGDYAALNTKERALLRDLLRRMPVVRDAVTRGEADEDMAVHAVEVLIRRKQVQFLAWQDADGLVQCGLRATSARVH